MFPLFQKYLNPQVRTNKLVNSVVYHPCPSRLASGIHPYFFFSPECLLNFLRTDLYIPPCVGKFFQFMAFKLECIKSMHFYLCPSSPLKIPDTIFWRSVFPNGQEQRRLRKLWFALLKFSQKIWRWLETLVYLAIFFMIYNFDVM